MFTQTFTRTFAKRVLSSDLVDLLTGPHGVDRYTELVDADLDVGRGPRQGGRCPADHAAQRHPDAGSERRVH